MRRIGNKSNASTCTLEDRASYGGRKGRRAARRLLAMGIQVYPGYKRIPFQFTDITFTIGGKKFDSLQSVNYGGISK